MPRGIWINPTNAGKHLEDNEERRIQICRAIDRNGFDWQVWAVAASGFFTDSYNLFATNVILPSLAYVYWPADTSMNKETIINVVTLLGSLLGQLGFGFLADRYGRRKLYGLELLVVIVATIGVAQSSNGYYSADDSSMAILGWIIFWRLLVGIGIGAEYPLSAVITAEFAPTKHRARMMASVFLMQPVGQIAASLVGLGAVMGIGHMYGLDAPDATNTDQARVAVDRIWRVVIGVGAIPALVAIIFRITIPESPRFTLDVEHDPDRAYVDAQVYFQSEEWDHACSPDRGPVPSDHEEMLGWGPPDTIEANRDAEEIPWPRDQASLGGRSNGSNSGAGSPDPAVKAAVGSQFTRAKLRQYFIEEGNWRYLAGTSLCWFFLDFAFYGLGINNPRTLASIWDAVPSVANANIPDWQSDRAAPNQSIYAVLVQDAKQSTITISIGSILGSLVLLKAIDYVPRKNFLAWSFITLAALMAITGGSLFHVFQTNQHAVTIVFYALSQFVFNVGPNTLTFIIPAEIFPTRYRATCHGISAASGKLGSIIILLILHFAVASNDGAANPKPPRGLPVVLLVFSVLMALGSLFAWMWVPDVQEQQRSKGWKLPSQTLEQLARGRIANRDLPADGRAESEAGTSTGGFRRALRRRRKQEE